MFKKITICFSVEEVEVTVSGSICGYYFYKYLVE